MHLSTLQRQAWAIAEAKGFHTDRGTQRCLTAREEALVLLAQPLAAIMRLAQHVKRYGLTGKVDDVLTGHAQEDDSLVELWLGIEAAITRAMPATPTTSATLRLILVATEVAEAIAVVGDAAALSLELADILIRVGDLAHERNIDLTAATVEKMRYNRTRPYGYGTPLATVILDASEA